MARKTVLLIRVSLVEPGDYDTPIVLQPASQVIDDYRQTHPRVIETRAVLMRAAPEPAPVAHLTARILEGESARLRYAVGREQWDVMWKRFLPEAIFDWFAQRTFKMDEN